MLMSERATRTSVTLDDLYGGTGSTIAQEPVSLRAVVAPDAYVTQIDVTSR
jgi:hypothetical protein